jgi:hypothetical protein
MEKEGVLVTRSCRCLEPPLDTKMSKFVSARLDPDGVQCGHKGLYWFGQKCPYVQWILLLLVLPSTKVLVVGVTSFRERERIPGLFGGPCVPECLVSDVSFLS